MNTYPNIDDIVYMQLPNAVGDWNWTSISEHTSIEQVKKYPDLPWNKKCISF